MTHKRKSMAGTPWHVEPLKMSENDSRRSKGKCKYYYSKEKICMCTAYNTNSDENGHCRSTRYCKAYREGEFDSRVMDAYDQFLEDFNSPSKKRFSWDNNHHKK